MADKNGDFRKGFIGVGFFWKIWLWGLENSLPKVAHNHLDSGGYGRKH